MSIETREKPTGNLFHFSPSNALLSPEAYSHAPLPISPKLQEITEGIKKSYVREGWQEAGTLISTTSLEKASEPYSLAFIFTHPDREAVTKTPPNPADFVHPETYLPNSSLKGIGISEVQVLKPDCLNQLLSGTNLRSNLLFAAFNVVNYRERVGFFGKDLMNIGYYQNGVAFLFSKLQAIDRHIFNIEYQMGREISELIPKIRLLDEQRTTLKEAIVPKPVPLL